MSFDVVSFGRSLAGPSLERPKADADQLKTKCHASCLQTVKNCLQLAQVFAVFCICLELKMPPRPSMIK